MNRIRQQDIADALGVHITTVSKALKNHPGVADATKRRVADQAERMGYRPDPMLQSLAAYRVRNASYGYRSTLAWVCNYPKGTDMSVHAGYDDYLAGARETAAALGYHLDVFHHPGNPEDLSSLLRVLRARGIRGMILAPQARPDMRIKGDFSELSVVTLGFTLSFPRFHLVTNDHFGTMLEILEQLSGEGFHHPACYLSEVDNHRMGRRARGALASFHRVQNIPVLQVERPVRREFLQWMERHPKMDVLITREQRAAAWLKLLKKEIPLYNYALPSVESTEPGMYHNNLKIGGAAMDLLARLVERNETGIPDSPLRIMLEGIRVPRNIA